MILEMDVHALSQGEGRGSGFLDALIPSRWHILSYEGNNFDQLAGLIPLRMTKSHDSIMMNTCDGLSDLKKKEQNGFKQISTVSICEIFRQIYICSLNYT